uniref:Uncharacterized protein n=1 Tax=Picea sitchensis TaxID=3332 RepID=A9P0S4_PICSI|nr:unknown [Picea sitchensis]
MSSSRRWARRKLESPCVEPSGAPLRAFGMDLTAPSTWAPSRNRRRRTSPENFPATTGGTPLGSLPTRLRFPGAVGQNRGEIWGSRVVQGRGADILGGRPRLPGEPQSDPRTEHTRHLGLPGCAHGLD